MRRLTLAVLSLAFLAACQPGVAPLSDEDIAALRDLQAAYTAGVLAGDADARAAVFAEDAVWWGPDAPAIEGRAAIRAAIEPTAGTTVNDFTTTSLETDGYGDVAFDRGTFTETYVSEGMEEAVTVSGKYVLIIRRQADGSWLWTVGIFNFDAPLPGPPEEG